MKKTIIYGMGEVYEAYKSIIETNWNVIFAVDKNPQKGKDINTLLDTEFDVVLITPVNYRNEIYNELINMGIAEEKIEFFQPSIYKELTNINSYSQFHEDLILIALFEKLRIDAPSYIDIGACHPYKISNTACFYEKGSRGINVEPNIEGFKLFEKYRPEDINLNVGCSTEKGVLDYYYFGEGSGLNTFSEENAKRNKNSGYELLKVIALPVITLDEIIATYSKNGFPDLLDIDVEGLDYDILETYDFSTDGPKVILVETDEIGKFDKLLETKGYFRYCQIACNGIYVRNELKMRLYLC